MSLLLKALQKAGEERIGVAGQASAHSPRELTLHPLDHVSTARKPIYTDASPAQAAAILAASSPPARAADYVRERPLVVFSAVAALFLVAYGSYVYFQLAPPAPAPVAYQPPPLASPAAASPTAALPAAALPGTASPSASRMASTNSGPIASAQAAQLPSARPVMQRLAPSLSAVAKEPRSPANSGAQFVANEPAFSDGNSTRSAQKTTIDESASNQPVSTPRSKQSAIAIAKSKPGPSPIPGFEPARSIDISRETPAAKINQDLADAYQALQSGHHADAESRYKKLAQAEPKNADVLLGLAAIAIQQNQSEHASEYYFRILESDPKNALAQAGLIAVGGQADRQNAETRLKQLIDREPSAFLYFVLGNLYADQAQWAAAQAAYFQAHHLQPDHPDYAFNLAIGLEHLSQRKLSVDYYRRALSLAALRGNASFDATTVERHVAELAAAGE
ncbi:MAG: tetratricopeptide repeat protein [Burkholderiales bacterium]|nr:tetratricopeptide repeat protein [Burkholderiales bacterium]